jgi:tRNA (guanine10-N2)-methyltransferase
LIRLPDYIPPKKAYSFEALLEDILFFAAEILVDGARLAMWMPTGNEEDIELAIPQSPYMELLSVSVQQFGKWARRLLVYARKPESVTGTVLTREAKVFDGKTADELNKFRRRVCLLIIRASH